MERTEGAVTFEQIEAVLTENVSRLPREAAVR